MKIKMSEEDEEKKNKKYWISEQFFRVKVDTFFPNLKKWNKTN